MARVLYDGLVEYEDGTPATTSQMAKDVVEFLNWSAEPEMDTRKKMGAKVLVISTVLFALSVWVKRYVLALPTIPSNHTSLCADILLTQVQMVAHEDEKDRIQPAGGQADGQALRLKVGSR